MNIVGRRTRSVLAAAALAALTGGAHHHAGHSHFVLKEVRSNTVGLFLVGRDRAGVVLTPVALQ